MRIFDKVNTKITKKGKGFDEKLNKKHPLGRKYDSTIVSFFKVLAKDKREGTYNLLKTNDVFSHLVMMFDFENRDLDFSNISTGKNNTLKVEDLYNAMDSNNFSNIVVTPKQLNILKHCSETGEGLIDLNFKDYVNRLLEFRSFSLESVRDVWAFQRDKESIIWGILSIPKKGKEEITNLNRIVPFENRNIYIPEVDKYISSPTFPILVQKMPSLKPRLGNRFQVKSISTDNVDEGIVITDAEDVIIDVLKINSFWVYDYPLANRIKFFGRFGIQEESLVCYNLRDVVNAIETLDIDAKDGVLIRSLVEPCIVGSCNWYNWSSKSMVTFKLGKENRNARKQLKTSDNVVIHDYNVDLDVDWKYMDISLDGEVVRKGEKYNFFMDKSDFDVWSGILKYDKTRSF